MYAGSTRFRPLSAGEVVGQTFEAYRRLWRQILPIPLVLTGTAYVVGGVLACVIWWPVLRGLHVTNSLVTGAPQFQYTGHVTGLVLRGILSGLIFVALMLCQVLQTAAVVTVVGQGYVSGSADWRAAVRLGWGRIRSILWIGVLAACLVLLGVAASVALTVGLADTQSVGLTFLGTVVAIAGWMYAAISLVVVIPVLIFEGKRGWAVFGRSWRLVRGRWWATLGTLVLISIVSSLIQGVLEAVLGGVIHSGIAGAIIGIILGLAFLLTTAPLVPIVTAFLFFDLSNRGDGVDLEEVAGRLGVRASASSPFNRSWGPGYGGPGYGYPPGYPPQPGGYPPSGYPPIGWPSGPPPGGYGGYPGYGGYGGYWTPPPQSPPPQPPPPAWSQSPHPYPPPPGPPPSAPLPSGATWPATSPKPPPPRTGGAAPPGAEPPSQAPPPPAPDGGWEG